MTRSAIRGAPKQAASGRPARPAVDRLSDVQIDAETGLHIGRSSSSTGSSLRVGIRPVPPAGPAAGPPLLIFNGIGANLELAGPMMSRLDEVETLIFDVPGAGKSPPPKSPYRLFWLARLARKLLDDLGYGTVDVMGVSWGGGLAQQFAHPVSEARAPPGAGGHRDGRHDDAAGTSAGAAEDGEPAPLSGQGLHEAYRARTLRRRPAQRPGGDQALHRPCARRRPGGYRTSCWRCSAGPACPGCGACASRRWCWPGDDDPLVPLINARIHAMLLPNARLHVLHDGHLFMLTRAQETADIVASFLGEALESGSA